MGPTTKQNDPNGRGRLFVCVCLLACLVPIDCKRTLFFSLKKSETELTASRKKIQNTQKIKRTLFNWTKQDSVLFRPIKNCSSFYLLCVLDLLFVDHSGLFSYSCFTCFGFDSIISVKLCQVQSKSFSFPLSHQANCVHRR